jgi:hypothetical protein
MRRAAGARGGSTEGQQAVEYGTCTLERQYSTYLLLYSLECRRWSVVVLVLWVWSWSWEAVEGACLLGLTHAVVSHVLCDL